jgi:hypothetical protein
VQKSYCRIQSVPGPLRFAANPHNTMTDEDLSEEQLKQLLVEAEQRLKGVKAQKLLQTQSPSSQKMYVHCSAHMPTGAF